MRRRATFEVLVRPWFNASGACESALLGTRPSWQAWSGVKTPPRRLVPSLDHLEAGCLYQQWCVVSSTTDSRPSFAAPCPAFPDASEGAIDLREGSFAGPPLTPFSQIRHCLNAGDSRGARRSPRRFFANQGVLVELGILPPRNPEAEAGATKEGELIVAYTREGSGKTRASKERKIGRVPSIVFEQANGHLGGNKQLVSVEVRQIATLLRKYGRSKFLSRSFDMLIIEEAQLAQWGLGGGGNAESEDGESSSEGPWEQYLDANLVTVLPKSVHEHCSSDELLNVTFLRQPKDVPGARVNVPVPLQFIGEDSCPGIRKGGWLMCMRRVVPYECPWDRIPPFIEVDLSSLRVGQIVRLADLSVDPACRLLVRNPHFPVCKIAGSKSLEAGSD